MKVGGWEEAEVGNVGGGGRVGERGRGVLEGEQGIGKMVERLTYTIRGREGHEDIVTAIMVNSRREIEQ